MLMVSLWYPVAEGYNPNPEDIFTSPLGLPISDQPFPSHLKKICTQEWFTFRCGPYNVRKETLTLNFPGVYRIHTI